ncbi:TetR/AcrR family transcriptional regulator [Streptomyces sp. NPDC005568]
MDAALEVFAAQTFAGARVPGIAKHAGVAQGTLYRYWPSKEALANDVYGNAKRVFLTYLRRSMPTTLPADEAEMRALFDILWRNLTDFAEEQTLMLIFLEHQQHAPFLDQNALDITREVEEFAHGLVRAGQRLGLFPPVNPQLLRLMVFGSYVGLSKGRTAGYSPSREEMIIARDALWALLTHGSPYAGT